jgi:transcriptional regulatory protein LevR
MKETTEEKLKVLNQAGRLDQDSFDFISDVDRYMESNFHNEDNEMLLIHLSVAINRMINNEDVDGMPNELWAQIISKPEYKVAYSVWNDLKPLAPVQFSKKETRYIILHILNILRRE